MHCPLTDKTRGLIDENALLDETVGVLINTARGGVGEPHLVAALEKKIIAGAGLDVTDPEPPLEGSPLYHMDNVVLTPHRVETAGDQAEADGRGRRERRGMLGGKPVNVVS